MKIELIIYVYLFICTGMIAFNIISVFVYHRRDIKTTRISRGFEETIKTELSNIKNGESVSENHLNYMTAALQREANMIAFDKVMDRICEADSQTVKEYLISLESVFVTVSEKYLRKDEIAAAYFPYIIGRYGILSEEPPEQIVRMLFVLLDQPSIYSRENAMQALYTTGNTEYVVKALKNIDRGNHFYHSKLISDGLLRFKGEAAALQKKLWEEFETFSTEMKVTLLNYFRFSSGEYGDRFLTIMNDESQDDEIRFACIRYFGKYFYKEAEQALVFYADCDNGLREEYCIIASMALALYPGEQTVKTLKKNLGNRNWYIRYNSSASLEKLGMTYLDLIDIIEGNDRYASEILRYRFDIRNVIEEEREEESPNE